MTTTLRRRVGEGSAIIVVGDGDTGYTDNAIARFDGTGGALQNSSVTIGDDGGVSIGGTPTYALRTPVSSLNGFGTSGPQAHNHFVGTTPEALTLFEGRINARYDTDTAYPIAVLRNMSLGDNAQLQVFFDRSSPLGDLLRWQIAVDVNDNGGFEALFNIEALDADGVISIPLSLAREGNVGCGGIPVAGHQLALGNDGGGAGSFGAFGSSSGFISFLPQAAAGTYNWNWPTTAGSAGQAILSGGGGSSPLTYTTGTLTLAGNFATSGANALTLTTTGATNVTLPTSGTLAEIASGTWTPGLTFGTPGDLSVAFSTQTGFYRKIGSLVTAWFTVVTSSFTHTTASGVLRITDLPFTNSANNLRGGSLTWQGITKANYTDVAPFAVASLDQIGFTISGSGQTQTSVTAADMPTGGSVVLAGSVTYFV